MKNIGLLFSTLCLFAGLGANQAKADNVEIPAGLSIAVEIEHKEITKEEAAALVASGEKVTLDVYLVLKGAGWKQFLNDNNFAAGFSRYSYAIFDDQTYTLGNYLQNPSDYILICVNEDFPKPSNVNASNVCRAETEPDQDGTWYSSPQWQLQNGGTGNLEWPTYAYSVGNGLASTRIRETGQYVIQDGDNLKIRLYSLQFVLKNATRNYPVGLIDEDFPFGLNGSHGASELNLSNTGANRTYVWPGYPTVPGTGKTGSDWTDCRGTSLFEFINGGIFIANGPDVETFEPYS